MHLSAHKLTHLNFLFFKHRMSNHLRIQGMVLHLKKILLYRQQ